MMLQPFHHDNGDDGACDPEQAHGTFVPETVDHRQAEIRCEHHEQSEACSSANRASVLRPRAADPCPGGEQVSHDESHVRWYRSSSVRHRKWKSLVKLLVVQTTIDARLSSFVRIEARNHEECFNKTVQCCYNNVRIVDNFQKKMNNTMCSCSMCFYSGAHRGCNLPFDLQFVNNCFIDTLLTHDPGIVCLYFLDIADHETRFLPQLPASTISTLVLVSCYDNYSKRFHFRCFFFFLTVMFNDFLCVY